MYYGTCLAGVYVFRMTSYRMMCLTGRCFTGGHVLLEGMPYRRPCLAGLHVLQEYFFLRMAYLTR